MKNKILFLFFLLGGVLFAGAGVSAFTNADLPVKIFDKDLKSIGEFNPFSDDFSGEIDMALADMDGDKSKEVVISLCDQKNDTLVKIYRQNGQMLSEFRPYVPGFTGMVYLAAADLDNDGIDEIITGAGERGGPQVRIFDGHGNWKFVKGFWADDENTYRKGVKVFAGDINSDGLNEIITTTYGEKMILRFFNRFGQEIKDSIAYEEGNFFEPAEIAVSDLGDDGLGELIINTGFGNKPELAVLQNDGTKLNSFMAYHPGFGGGVDLDWAVENGEKVFVTGAGFTGGPHVRFLNSFGEPIKNLNFFVYTQDYKGGVNVAAADVDNDGSFEYVTAPKILFDGNKNYWPKHIEVDISKQMLYAYQYGKLVKSFYISSGTYRHPTPYGKFTVYSKRRSARMAGYYGPGNPDNYDLPGVPYILSFNGPYTIHGTYWHSNFGHRMSHGCVNMYTPNAKWVYEWAPMGTPVIVHNGNINAVLGN
ncbi:MAG: L,D-transpeptidase family protein [Patescibacteria group bacterium]